MHIPDGFLDGKTAATAATFALVGLGCALRQAKRELAPRRVPLLGLGAAFVFAAQMVNFPVVGGTSGHLIGAALVAALLGLPAAVIVMSTVLIAQCLLFADGGVTALGANVFNLAVVAPVVGIVVFRAVRQVLPGLRGQVAAMAFAGWCSTVAAAVACAGQLAWSGTVGWAVALPAMMGIHMVIGLGEGVLGALVFHAVARVRPELAGSADGLPSSAGGRDFVGYGMLAALGVAVFVAPFACPWPDGLETVAAKLGLARRTVQELPAWMAGYHMPGIGSPAVATALAGAFGSLVVFGLSVLLGRMVVRRRGAGDGGAATSLSSGKSEAAVGTPGSGAPRPGRPDGGGAAGRTAEPREFN
jgi:cobalt/nickel transport system permease protein